MICRLVEGNSHHFTPNYMEMGEMAKDLTPPKSAKNYKSNECLVQVMKTIEMRVRNQWMQSCVLSFLGLEAKGTQSKVSFFLPSSGDLTDGWL